MRNSLLLAPMPTASTSQILGTLKCGFAVFCLFVCLFPKLCHSQYYYYLSHVSGNNECFEPFTSNIYSRRVLAGEFTIINKHLINDLIALGLWNDTLKNKIVERGGSIQGIVEIPANTQYLYRTVWELKMKVCCLYSVACLFAFFICLFVCLLLL
jgi:ribonucleotide reductase alpha subunit